MSSAVVGYLAVRFFIRYVGRHSLAPFAWYRLALAAAVLAWWLTR
jgi:undecaprenyl-diphosphatase